MNLIKNKKQIISYSVFVGVLFLVMPVFAFEWFSIEDMIMGTCNIVMSLALGFMSLAMWFLDVMISNEIYQEVFFSDGAMGAINIGWELVRDFINMFFILILIFLAIATILGVNKYSDKKILISVISSALLVNFSKPVALLFIDMSQLAMGFFMERIASTNASFSTNLAGAANMSSIITGNTFSDTTGYILITVVKTIFFLIFGMMIMTLAVTLVVRMVAFWVLIVLSPVAFFGMALPGSGIERAKNDWFTKMFSWAIYGPVLLFFLWLALVLVNAMTSSAALSGSMQSAISGLSFSDPENGKKLVVGAVKSFIPFISSIYFMFYGMDTAKKFASGAGTAATGILNKGQGVINRKLRQAGTMAKGAAVGATVGAAGAAYAASGARAYKTAATERLQDTFKNSNLTPLRALTKEGRKRIEEERVAKYKRDLGKTGSFGLADFGDKGAAMNKLNAQRSMEVTKSIKENGASTEDLKKWIDKGDAPKRIAAARALADRGVFYKEVEEKDKDGNVIKDEKGNVKKKKVSIYEDMMNTLSEQPAFAEEVKRKTLKENKDLVLDSDVRKAFESEQFEGTPTEIERQKRVIKRDIWDKTLRDMKKTDYQKQNHSFYEDPNKKGVMREEVWRSLLKMKQKIGDKEMKKIHSELGDTETMALWEKYGLVGAKETSKETSKKTEPTIIDTGLVDAQGTPITRSVPPVNSNPQESKTDQSNDDDKKPSDNERDSRESNSGDVGGNTNSNSSDRNRERQRGSSSQDRQRNNQDSSEPLNQGTGGSNDDLDLTSVDRDAVREATRNNSEEIDGLNDNEERKKREEELRGRLDRFDRRGSN